MSENPVSSILNIKGFFRVFCSASYQESVRRTLGVVMLLPARYINNPLLLLLLLSSSSSSSNILSSLLLLMRPVPCWWGHGERPWWKWNRRASWCAKWQVDVKNVEIVVLMIAMLSLVGRPEWIAVAVYPMESASQLRRHLAAVGLAPLESVHKQDAVGHNPAKGTPLLSGTETQAAIPSTGTWLQVCKNYGKSWHLAMTGTHEAWSPGWAMWQKHCSPQKRIWSKGQDHTQSEWAAVPQ